MNRAVLFAAPLLVLLSACEDTEAEPEAVEQGGEAGGDVLGGSISDDMLPLEQLESQSPPARRSSSNGAGDDGQ